MVELPPEDEDGLDGLAVVVEDCDEVDLLLLHAAASSATAPAAAATRNG
jgi:hypothetical protein